MSDLNSYEESLAVDLARAQARIKELEADLRNSALDYLAAEGQAAEAYQAQLAAEAKLAKAVKELQRLGFDFESVVGREIMGVGEDRG